MERNELFLKKARQLLPELYEQNIEVASTVRIAATESGTYTISQEAAYETRELKKGDAICLDFGDHQVGYLSLDLNFTGSHPDAPVWLRLKFAERPCELFENAEDYKGWISSGWIQQEQLHIDVLPCQLKLPRRYAFRYVQIEVLDVSSKFCLKTSNACCRAVTSADDLALKPYNNDNERLVQLDKIACRTLRNCMQTVFEDGPKRDRRLWIGDLRMQALANYETYQNNDLVKACLYLFAGNTLAEGRVGACIFLEPQIEVDDTHMFDYSLFFIPTLLDYWRATGDDETLRQLWPTAWRQIELAKRNFDEHGLIRDSDVLGWCFVDWNLELNKQASGQGTYLYCLKAAMAIAQQLGESDKLAELQGEYSEKQNAAKKYLWNEEKGFFTSGAQGQISWASQVWMVLGGAVNANEAAHLLERLPTEPKALEMVTPYMYHNYVDALVFIGQSDKAKQVLAAYWGGMLKENADTFWELYNPANPTESPYGGSIVNSYCHAWSCAPAYFLRKYF